MADSRQCPTDFINGTTPAQHLPSHRIHPNPPPSPLPPQYPLPQHLPRPPNPRHLPPLKNHKRRLQHRIPKDIHPQPPTTLQPPKTHLTPPRHRRIRHNPRRHRHPRRRPNPNHKVRRLGVARKHHAAVRLARVDGAGDFAVVGADDGVREVEEGGARVGDAGERGGGEVGADAVARGGEGPVAGGGVDGGVGDGGGVFGGVDVAEVVGSFCEGVSVGWDGWGGRRGRYRRGASDQR